MLVCWVYQIFLIALLFSVSSSKFVGPGFMFNADCGWWLRSAAGLPTELWGSRFAKHPILTPLVTGMGYFASFVERISSCIYAPYAAMALFLLLLHLAIAVLLSMVWNTFQRLSDLRSERIRLFLPIVGLSSVAFLVALPESFGIAMALLLTCWTMVFSAVCRNVNISRSRIIAAAFVCGGCTTTNALAPIVNGVITKGGLSPDGKSVKWEGGRFNRWVATLTFAFIGSLLILGICCYHTVNIREVVQGFLPSALKEPLGYFNFRLVRDPIKGMLYSLWGTVAPVIPPIPTFRLFGLTRGLTYEPVSFRQFSLFQWPGILAWWTVIAHGICSRWERHERFLTISCFAWLIWNLVFHNLWGDEFFLFSPHWVWCLWLLFGMGFRKLKSRIVPVVAACIILAQVIGWVSLLRAANIAAGGNAPINKLLADLDQ